MGTERYRSREGGKGGDSPTGGANRKHPTPKDVAGARHEERHGRIGIPRRSLRRCAGGLVQPRHPMRRRVQHPSSPVELHGTKDPKVHDKDHPDGAAVFHVVVLLAGVSFYRILPHDHTKLLRSIR
eukprot:scaffold625_cov324-Pavlova_lutheri.AAC.100